MLGLPGYRKVGFNFPICRLTKTITLVSAEAKADDRPYNAVELKIAAEFKGNEQHRVPNRGRIRKIVRGLYHTRPVAPYSSPTFKINFPKFSPLYNFCSVSGNVSNP